MTTPTPRTAPWRQVLRRIYPHTPMGYARQYLQGFKLGPVSIADAAGFMETLLYFLLPRETHGVVRSLIGLNTELCQAGPVNQPRPVRRPRTTRPDRPVKRKLAHA